MRDMARLLGQHRFTLRSGGAQGADAAFETGADEVQGLKEIYLPPLPWKKGEGQVYAESPEAEAIAREIHPAWGSLSGVGQRLHTRNVHQVLGRDLDSPSWFLICWTQGGKAQGGTRTALVLARERHVPCFNLGSRQWTLKEILQVVKRRRAKTVYEHCCVNEKCKAVGIVVEASAVLLECRRCRKPCRAWVKGEVEPDEEVPF